MPQFDWSRFTLKIFIQRNMQDVYAMFMTPGNLEHWFLRKAEFTSVDGIVKRPDTALAVGDTYLWMWHGHPDETWERGVITEMNGKDRFQFLFGSAGLVTFQLAASGGDTEMTITQENIPVDEAGKINYHIGCSVGWTFYLANIKSILEGGHDLRNKRLDRKGVVNS